MGVQHARQRAAWTLIVALSAVVCLVPAAPAVRAEDDLGRLDTSLKWIPADAAFYDSMLRNREQIEAIARSKAWARLNALPLVQQLWKAAGEQLRQPGSPLAQAWQLYQRPENQQLVQLLIDMGSEEVFVYGGSSFVDFADLVTHFGGSMNLNSAFLQMSGQAGSSGQAQLRAVLGVLADNKDLIKVPDLVIGFRITNAERAQGQLKRLETFLKGALEHHPRFRGRLHREKVAGGSFLTLRLDGEMIPWDEIPFADVEDTPGQYDDLLKRLKALKLSISLGVRNGYVLLAVGPSTKDLERLGQGTSLAERPEMKPLNRYAGQKLVSISYISRALRSRATTSRKDIDGYVKMAEHHLAKADLPDDVKDRMKKDLAALASDVKSLIPEVGASSACSFLNGRGVEGYEFTWGDHSDLDSGKPLTILEHVGGNPIVAFARRSKPSGKTYHLLVKWLKVANQYVEDLVVPRLDEDRKAQYERVTKALYPILRRLDRVTTEQLFPAMQDGQWAFVLDATLKSRQWYRGMPRADKPLPMLEPALVIGVSDANKFRTAFTEYRKIINDLTRAAHDLFPMVPAIQLPAPSSQTVKGGTLYYYPLLILPLIGIDPQIAPAAGLSDHFLTLAISHKHAERLLAATPLAKTPGPLANPARPLAGAVYVNWPALVDAVNPWVEYGAQVAGPRIARGVAADDDEPNDRPSWNIKEILPQIHTALDILKVFRTYTSGTYLKDGVLVTHSELVIEDR